MKDLAWAYEIAEAIYQKQCAVTARNADKIPYTAEGGVYDDMSTRNICWWTNGFRAGLLWQLYGWKQDAALRAVAERIEDKLDENLFTAQGMDHDSGFKWLLTSVASHRLTGSEKSRNRALLAANDLAGRFNLAGGFLRAWNDCGDGSTAGWAIIDCMMNLPLLYWASETLHDPRFSQIAVRHADTAKRAFVREDGSVCHIVVFDPATGERLHSLGGQGYGHGSSWTRGQAWALYGFALSHRHTGNGAYLQTAERVARYFLDNIPQSGLVPVDFRQPASPAWEDDTAASIAACGLIELWRATQCGEYHDGAVRLLRALAKQCCDFSPQTDPLLTKCTAAYHDEAHEFPIIYGDYFFTEAILKLCGKETFLW